MSFSKFFLLFSRTLKKSLLHLAFPSKCLSCHILLSPDTWVLCSQCASLLELLNPQDCCPKCFDLLPEEFSSLCYRCLEYRSPFMQIAAAFNYEGTAAALIKKLKYFNQPYLARGMAAFLFLQFDKLQWPVPDAIIPVPVSFLRWLERGYNQSALLAEELGVLLKCPVWHVLKRHNGNYSQAALNLDQRKSLNSKNFSLKHNQTLEGKVLLLIDDVKTTGSTLNRCGETLELGKPASIYALTFCRTV